MTSIAPAAPRSLTVLTVNIHKGFDLFNRRFVLKDLRDAVRNESADIVFLQEVQGSHELHATRFVDWPSGSHYEFLADTVWKDYAYGQNAVYPARPPRQRAAVEVSDPEPRQPRRLGRRRQRAPRHAALRAGAARAAAAAACDLRAPGPARAPPQRAAADAVHADRRATSRATRRWSIAGDFNDWRMKAHSMLQRCAGLRGSLRAVAAAARRGPSRRAGRCCRWTASTCGTSTRASARAC